jgi:hypothetical protein
VADAFKSEAANVQRLIGLSPEATEKMLCAVWMNPARRQAWSDGFMQIGANATTRLTFDEYYRSLHSDGAKVRTFFELYANSGVVPSEVDYGFIIDRATETSAPPADRIPALASTIQKATAGKGNPNAWARLSISRALPAGNAQLRADRKGRDMAFVLDALDNEEVLTEAERTAWQGRGQYRASDVGLSDGRAVPTFSPVSVDLAQMPAPGSTQLTIGENDACPAAVLHPR